MVARLIALLGQEGSKQSEPLVDAFLEKAWSCSWIYTAFPQVVAAGVGAGLAFIVMAETWPSHPFRPWKFMGSWLLLITLALLALNAYWGLRLTGAISAPSCDFSLGSSVAGAFSGVLMWALSKLPLRRRSASESNTDKALLVGVVAAGARQGVYVEQARVGAKLLEKITDFDDATGAFPAYVIAMLSKPGMAPPRALDDLQAAVEEVDTESEPAARATIGAALVKVVSEERLRQLVDVFVGDGAA